MTVGSVLLEGKALFKLKAALCEIVIILKGVKLLFKSYTSLPIEPVPNEEMSLFTIHSTTKKGIEILHQRPVLFGVFFWLRE